MEKNYLKLKPEHEEWLKNRIDAEEAEIEIDPEHLYIAQLGRMYGYQAVKDVLNNKMDSKTMAYLVGGGKKVRSRELYETAEIIMLAVMCAFSKNPAESFEKVTENLKKNMKANYE